MSRFYEALKEGIRSHQSGTNGDQDLDAFGLQEIEVPTIPPAPAPTSAPPNANGTADAIWADVTAGTVFEGPVAQEPSLAGAAAKAAPDPKARLIPNAVGREVVEHYRRLRTKIMTLQEARPFRSVVVTSASPQEGKTVTVVNLALSFAMLPSFKVLVVDGDLRRGTLGTWLGVGDHPGLGNLLDGSASLEDVVLKSDDIPFHFIVAGTSAIAPAELLPTSQTLQKHFHKLAGHFDIVLVDSPPVNVVSDAQYLAASCDAVLLVTRAFSTTRKAFEDAIQEVSRFRLLGTVLNAGAAQSPRRYNGYYSSGSRLAV